MFETCAVGGTLAFHGSTWTSKK